jgi:hypothetical protein
MAGNSVIADATSTAEPPLAFETLPFDALCGIISWLDTLDVCGLARTSKALHTVACNELIWAERLSRHCGESGGRVEGRGGRLCFRDAWTARMADIEHGLAFLDNTELTSQPHVCAAVGSAASPMVCSTSPAMRSSLRGIDPARFKRGVDTLHAYGPSASSGLIDWLRTSAATRHPLRSLAVLVSLHALAYPKLGCSEAVSGAAERRAAVLHQLAFLSRAPPPSLRKVVTVEWSTWSQLRDCRGFRARDDLHRSTASLQELCDHPEAQLWAVLERGECHEVRELRLFAGEGLA